MTHEYTLLVGGVVIPGGGEPDATAIAWAGDTVLALGNDDDVRAISRGDSHLFDLGGAIVVPLGPGADTAWPTGATLEVGSLADLAVLDRDPRLAHADGPGAGPAGTLAVVRGGRIVAGSLPLRFGGGSRMLAASMPNLSAPLRLLIVDDHEVVRLGLVAFLDRREQFQVVAEAGTCAQAVAQARRFLPDIVLLDIQLPDASGIEACRLLRDEFPDLRVVFLTSSPDELDVFAAIVSGARGYVLKQTRSAQLVRTLEAVGRGESMFDAAVTGMVLDRVRRIAGGTYPDETTALTAREREILPLIAAGQTNREIAAAVFLSDKTVKNYVSSILAKLGLDRRAQVPTYVATHDPQPPAQRRTTPGH